MCAVLLTVLNLQTNDHLIRYSYSKGRVANLTNVYSPGVERAVHHYGGFESAWRGGAGNLRSNSATRDPSGRRPPRNAKVQPSAALQSQGGSYVFHALDKQARLPAPAM